MADFGQPIPPLNAHQLVQQAATITQVIGIMIVVCTSFSLLGQLLAGMDLADCGFYGADKSPDS
jgi:hypothetical protein